MGLKDFKKKKKKKKEVKAMTESDLMPPFEARKKGEEMTQEGEGGKKSQDHKESINREIANLNLNGYYRFKHLSILSEINESIKKLGSVLEDSLESQDSKEDDEEDDEGEEDGENDEDDEDEEGD